MRIVHVSDGYLPRAGGIEHHVHDLALHEVAAGHEVTVITTVPGAPGDEPLAVRRPPLQPGVDPTALQPGWALSGTYRQCLREADVVHVHSSTFSPLAFRVLSARSRAGAPTVATMHSMLARSATWFGCAAAVFGWRRPNTVWTAVSTAAVAQLTGAFGRGVPVGVLPNAVDPAAWLCDREPQRPGRLTVATAGRLAARKRPRELLDVLHAARRRLQHPTELRAILAGDGPLRPRLERVIRRRDMTAWTELVGAASRDELRAYYAQADVYVAPARLESFGIATLEARCAGLPVIAYRDSGVADFVIDHVDGLLVDNDAQMAEAIVQLAREPELLARLKSRAAEVRPPLSWAEVLPMTLAFYEQAIAAATEQRLDVAP